MPENLGAFRVDVEIQHRARARERRWAASGWTGQGAGTAAPLLAEGIFMPDKAPGRVRFVECVIEPSAKGVRARCVLADASGASFTGNAQGERHHDPELWYGAEATVDALRQTLEVTAQDLKLRDVVAFEIGDHPAVAVELRVLVDGHKRKLHGLCQAEADRPRAVALAVLAATNRFFSQG